jgi:HPt (histidine-containing phosphotransfer) domain-containing protein
VTISHGPVIQADFDALLELLDRDTMREIIAMYVESCPQRIATMRDGLAAGDLVTVATAFHTMRSGCGQLGARQLEELCALGERSAKAGSTQDATAMLARVEAELALVIGWFRAQGWMEA